MLCPKIIKLDDDGFLLASLMTTHPSPFYTPGRKCLRGGRCRQVLGFAHLLHATFGRPLNSIKNASKRIKLPSLDLPVTSVTVGRHLERRRALCRCSSRSRGSRGRRKAPFPQGEAGRRMAPRWCRCLRDTESNISISAVIPNDKIMLTEHCSNIGPFYAFLSLAYVVVQHEQSSSTVSIAKSWKSWESPTSSRRES